MYKLYEKLKKQYWQLSKKRRIFYALVFSILLLVFIIPFSVKAGMGTAVVSILGLLVGFLIDLLAFILKLEMMLFLWFAKYNNFLDVTSVKEGWRLVRDVCNMFFIIVLLIISFATILKIESYAYKKWLGKLVIAAILINFSKTITGLLIGFSQVVMLTFVGAFKDAAIGNFSFGLHISEIMKISATNELPGSGKPSSNIKENIADVGAIVAALFFALALLTVFATVMLIMIVILVGRMISFWVLIILSPLAYLLQASPFGIKYAKQWWQELGKNLVSGPVLAFFLWLAFLTIQRSSGRVVNDMEKGQKNAANDTVFDDEGQGAFITGISKTSYMIDFVVVIALLMAAIKMTQEMGVIGSSFAGKMQQNLGKLAKGGIGFGLNYLDRKQALGFKTKKVDKDGKPIRIGSGIYFSKLIPHIKAGLSARKKDEETEIMANAGKMAQEGSGFLAIARGITAGPEAAKELVGRGFLGIKSIKDFFKISFGKKGTYKEYMKEAQNQKKDLDYNNKIVSESKFKISMTVKEKHANQTAMELEQLYKNRDEYDKKLEDTELSGEERTSLENKKKKNDAKIKDKEQEMKDYSTTMVLNKDKDIKANEDGSKYSEIITQVIKPEIELIKKEYDKKVEDIAKDDPLREEKEEKLRAEQNVKIATLKHSYQLDKDDTTDIDDALEKKRKVDIKYVEAEKEHKKDIGKFSSREEKKYNQQLQKIKDSDNEEYKFQGRKEDYAEFLRNDGKKKIETIQFANRRGDIDDKKAEEKIAKIKEKYGLGDNKATLLVDAENALGEEEEQKRKDKINKKYEKSELKLNQTESSINVDVENIVNDFLGENSDNITGLTENINNLEEQINNLKQEKRKINDDYRDYNEEEEGNYTDEKKKRYKESRNRLKTIDEQISKFKTEQEKIQKTKEQNEKKQENLKENISSDLPLEELIAHFKSLLRKEKNKDKKNNLKKKINDLEALQKAHKENEEQKQAIEKKKKDELNSKANDSVRTSYLKDTNDVLKLLKSSLESLVRGIENISVPKSISARMAERSLIEDRKKEFSGINDAGELLSYLKSAVNNKDIYKTRAILEKMASDGNDNEFLNEFGYVSNAIGMEEFRRDILKDTLGMSEQSSLQILNDLGYINEKVGHWETARLVNVDPTGTMSSKIKKRADGSWDDTDHAIEAFAEISKMSGRRLLNDLNRLAYGGEKVRSDGSGRDFEFSNLGRMIITMLNGDKELLAKRGSEININAAQNFMNPAARSQLANLVGKDSHFFNTIRKVSGDLSGVRSDYESIYQSLLNRGMWR